MATARVDALEDRCIFMTEPMRSGGALVSRMIGAHPDVAISVGTLNFFRYFYGRYDPISDSVNVRRLVKDAAFILYNRYEIAIDQDECMANIGTENLSYGQIYLGILRSMLSYNEKPIVGDDEGLKWTKIPDFLRMCPNGKVLSCLRDPRDVVTSFKHMTIAPGNDYLIALFNVVDAVNHLYRFRDLYPDRVYIIGFERLKTDTEAELRRICSFLELEFTPEMIDGEHWTDDSGDRWDDSRSLTFKDDIAWLAPVGRWKRRLGPEDLYLCEWIAEAQIARLGLSLDGRVHEQSVFDEAIKKVTSSSLLREAFKRWCDSGEGMERFPLDPLNPSNWEPHDLKHPEAFEGQPVAPTP